MGAGGWTHLNDKILFEENWNTSEELQRNSKIYEEKLNNLIGKKITAFICYKKSMKMIIENNVLEIKKDPFTRPNFYKSNTKKIITGNLKKGVFLSPSPCVLV